jgi:hypothetical protein
VVENPALVDERGPLPAQQHDPLVEPRQFTVHLVEPGADAGDQTVEVDQFAVPGRIGGCRFGSAIHAGSMTT